jgi:hypothetical protein
MRIGSRGALSMLAGVLVTAAPLPLIPVLDAGQRHRLDGVMRVWYFPADAISYCIKPTPHHPDLTLWMISMIGNVLFYSALTWILLGRPWSRAHRHRSTGDDSTRRR